MNTGIINRIYILFAGENQTDKKLADAGPAPTEHAVIFICLNIMYGDFAGAGFTSNVVDLSFSVCHSREGGNLFCF